MCGVNDIHRGMYPEGMAELDVIRLAGLAKIIF